LYQQGKRLTCCVASRDRLFCSRFGCIALLKRDSALCCQCTCALEIFRRPRHDSRRVIELRLRPFDLRRARTILRLAEIRSRRFNLRSALLDNCLRSGLPENRYRVAGANAVAVADQHSHNTARRERGHVHLDYFERAGGHDRISLSS